jgi:outer membrane protein OmpA-like peptidoglycan-associated protein
MVRLNNLFFDFNKATLKQESYVELDQLVKLMQTKPNLKIEIDGHTDDVGEDAYNLTLSLNRAKSVYTYLISKGIAANRLTFKGFGEKAPVKKGTDEKARQLNRRVEFKILAK